MSSEATSTSAPATQRVVARNTLILMLGQVLGMPFALLVNMLMGRMLGPKEYGHFYILSTFATLAFLFVDWGQGSTLPARIASDRPNAGRYLGSVMSWNVFGTLVATITMATIFYLLNEGANSLLAVLLVCVTQALALVVKNAADAVRGFERTDVAAYAQVGTQLLVALLVIPVLLLGGNLIACLVATAAASLIVLVPVWRSLHPVGIGKLSTDRTTIRVMLSTGTSFLVLNLVLYLQPTIDAYFLKQFASPEAIGWHAAVRKLINPLVFPASAIIAALYPTLCRLWTQDVSEYKRTAQGALRVSIIITVPLAIGCAVFAELGILLFSKEAYGPAQTNLRVLSPYIFVVYVTMVIGTCLNAAGKQRFWTLMAVMCIAVSSSLEPLLVPWFQKNMGNGGLGVNIATVTSETLMLGAGIWMLPAGIIDRSVMKVALLALLAGCAMAASAWLLSSITVFVVAPISVAIYAAVLYSIGGIDTQQIKMLRSLMKK